jgi:acyl carrier protein
MEMNEFIEKFAEQFDEIEVETLNADTNFRNLEGWTSLVALLVITMIDEEYDITITGDDMKKQITIGDLFNLVSSRL